MRETDERLLRALRTLFRPLANVLLKNKIGIGPVIEQLKLSFVQSARANHGRSGKPATVNMISQLTGLSRKHVSTLLSEADQDPFYEPIVPPVGSEVLHVWVSDANYLDKTGLPSPLELGPGRRSFQSLVEKCVERDDVKSTIADMLQSDSVQLRPDGKIEMVERRYSINSDLPRMIFSGLYSLAGTIDKNWDRGEGEGFVQRQATTTRLDPEKVAVVRRIARERVARLMEEIDDMLCGYELEGDAAVSDANDSDARELGIGAYYFEHDQ